MPQAALEAPAVSEWASDLQLARRYGVSRATIWRWSNKEKRIPAPVKLTPGTTRWRLADVIEAL